MVHGLVDPKQAERLVVLFLLYIVLSTWFGNLGAEHTWEGKSALTRLGLTQNILKTNSRTQHVSRQNRGRFREELGQHLGDWLDVSWLFNGFFMVFGVLIIPKWLINDSGRAPILSEIFWELPKRSPNLDLSTPSVLPKTLNNTKSPQTSFNL